MTLELTRDPLSPIPLDEIRSVVFPSCYLQFWAGRQKLIPGASRVGGGEMMGREEKQIQHLPAVPVDAAGLVHRVPCGAFALCLCLPGENKYKNNAYSWVSYINKCLGRDLAVGNLLGKSWSDGNCRVKHSSLTWMCLGFDLYF